MNTGIFLLLGSNLGDADHNLSEARHRIGKEVGPVVRSSRIYKTAAWGNTQQPAFLNQVIEVQSMLDPETLLKKILLIETDMGRQRTEKWGPRTIDIDILLFNTRVIDSPHLRIPHPEMQNRKFTLIPLCEIAKDFYHPVLKKNIRTLLAECTDTLEVELLHP